MRLLSENHWAVVLRVTTLLLVAALRLSAAGSVAGICEVMDSLSTFRNASATLQGEVVGSFRHGFFLVPIGRQEVCRGWPEWGLTRRAMLAIYFPFDRHRGLEIPSEFLHLQNEIQSGHYGLKVFATITGVVNSDRIVITYRTPSGRWVGLVGGQWPDESVPGALVVQRVEAWRIWR